MRLDGGTQTKDVGRMDQNVWMGYNHINPTVSLAGHTTGGRSPAFQEAHVIPLFPDGFTQVPFLPSYLSYPSYAKGRLWGWYLASMPVMGVGQPVPWSHLESLGASLPSWYTQVIDQCCQAVLILKWVRVVHQNPLQAVKEQLLVRNVGERMAEKVTLMTIWMAKTQFTC